MIKGMHILFKTFIWLLLGVFLSSSSFQPGLQGLVQPEFVQHELNALTGDLGLRETRALLPWQELSETSKIQAHLHFVERWLRQHPPADLSPAQAQARAQHLDALQTYWQAGHFPSQSAYPGRRPRFVDDRGQLCAVGYLISRSGHPDLTQHLKQRFEYAYLLDMQDPQLDTWVANSGLSAQELAMIQPTYGPAPDPLFGQVAPLVGTVSFLLAAALGITLLLTTDFLSPELQLYGGISLEILLLVSGLSFLLYAFKGERSVAMSWIALQTGGFLILLSSIALFFTVPHLWAQPPPTEPNGLQLGFVTASNNAYFGLNYTQAF